MSKRKSRNPDNAKAREPRKPVKKTANRSVERHSCVAAPRVRPTSCSDAAAAKPGHGAGREFDAWWAKYRKVAEEIERARERRREARRRNAKRRAREFGDLCEATDGLAKFAREQGVPLARLGDYFYDRASRKLVPRVLPSILAALRREATRRIDAARHRLMRPVYYEKEKARRQALAEARRRVAKRTTTRPCPTKEEVLDAWIRAKESPLALLRFGAMIEDLECHVDNSLLRDEGGAIVGRRAGVKGWLRENLPALASRYKSVMAYKAAARRMRQIAGLEEPESLSDALPSDGQQALSPADGQTGSGNSAYLDHSVDEIYGRRRDAVADGASEAGKKIVVVDERASDGMQAVSGDERAVGEVKAAGGNAKGYATTEMSSTESVHVETLRARAVCIEVLGQVGSGARRTTALMRRLDDLLSPERVEDANMLKVWREKYEREITARTKNRWAKWLDEKMEKWAARAG